jgi:hypothetical protein
LRKTAPHQQAEFRPLLDKEKTMQRKCNIGGSIRRSSWISIKQVACEIVVICAASAGLCRAVQAAQTTFVFDATITDVFPGEPFDLPLSYQVGDVVQGKFTFEPGSGSPIGVDAIAAVQSFPIEFNINGIIVGSSSYRIEVFDDTAFDDSEFPEPIDVTTLGCNEPSCIPDLLILPEGEPFRVRSRMQLVGNGSILLSPEISADPATWNAFVLERRFNLNFDNEGLGSMGFQATANRFSLVPEPATFRLVLSGLLLAAFICLAGWIDRWRRRYRTGRVCKAVFSPFRPNKNSTQ